MGTFFACLHRALEDKTVSSVKTDLGAEACSVWQDHLSSFRKCSRFPIRYNIAKDSLLISNSFTNNFSVSFRFQSTSSAKCSWPGSEFTRWPTRLSYAGVCVLRLAFNFLWMKFLDSKSFVEKDTFQCHLLQSLKITSYSAPFLNSK